MIRDLTEIRDPLVLRGYLPEPSPVAECEACGDPTDKPPVCRECASDGEAAAAWKAEQP